MNAAASSLIEAIKYAFGSDPNIYPPGPTGPDGTDWDVVPTGSTSWYKYGSGGVNSWGTLCGVPNGCIAILNLMGLNTAALVDQVMFHYCQTEFPCKGLRDLQEDPTYGWDTDFAPIPLADDEVLAYTVANSPLCHASVSKWAYAANVDMAATTPYETAHKTDRCAKVSAAGAAFTAELLNGLISDLTMPTLTAQCYGCHQTHTSEGLPAQQGKMDCLECHTNAKPHTGVRLVIEDVWTADESGNAKNIFTAGDAIQCKVGFSVLGAGSPFVKTYQSRAAGKNGKILALPKAETLSAGTHEWTWSGTIPGGCKGAARVIINMRTFDEEGGKLLDDASKAHKFTIA
jgi:hypothetical protein